MNDHLKDIRPPRWSQRLLRFFLRKEYLEEIEGDIDEVFKDCLEQNSIRKARRLYSREVIKAIRPALIKRLINTQKLNYLSMLQHNLLITFRGFRRHKTTFLINLIGLSTGLAAALLIFLWVDDERSVDTFHEKNDQLYWIKANFENDDGIITWDYTSGRLAQGLLDDFPEVEEAIRVGNGFNRPRGSIGYNENHFLANGLFVGKNFFDVMSYQLLIGNPKEVLQDKSSVLLTEWLAESIFGNAEQAIGKTISWETRFFNREFVVSGIYKAPPKNSSKRFNIILNYENLIDRDRWAGEWNGGYAQTYVVLKEGTDIDLFNQKIARYLDGKATMESFTLTLFAQQYSKNYLHGKFTNGVQDGGRIENVKLFTFIGIFILAIACINFMNLSTAQASKKLKEVGVKKAVGAKRGVLVFQFLSESVLLALISLIVSVGIVALVLPEFNAISGKSLELEFQRYALPILSIVLLTGIFAGSYPAFYLSGFKPVAVLKGTLTNLRGEEWIRKGLVVVQFGLSVIFIIGVIAINQQIKFTEQKSLGYDREAILTFRERGSKFRSPQPFFNELKKIPGVISAGNVSGDFLAGDDNNNGFSWLEGTKEDDNHLFQCPKIGFGLIETLGLEIIAGRSFSPDFQDGIHTIIINEAAAEFMEIDDPIGKTITWTDDQKMEIIGVVKNFQYGSLHNKIEPLIFQFRRSGKQYLIKMRPGTEVETIDQVQKVFEAMHPGQIFVPSLLADDYTELYHVENKVANLSNYMAGIAIIISCLGLFGLAAFTAERRAKEIGIRKILGASQLTIVGLLTKVFTKTVLVAVVIALPLGYYLVNTWLQNFAYAIELQWWFFLIAGASALFVAWLTVGFQTFRAATINPAQSLRNE